MPIVMPSPAERDPIDWLCYWIKEREAIRLKKEAGEAGVAAIAIHGGTGYLIL
jgi:hypothetical protein